MEVRKAKRISVRKIAVTGCISGCGDGADVFGFQHSHYAWLYQGGFFGSAGAAGGLCTGAGLRRSGVPGEKPGQCVVYGYRRRGRTFQFCAGRMLCAAGRVIYQKHRTRKAAFFGALLGAAVMAVVSIFSNYYIVYPIYTAIMPMETILGMYQAIAPGVQTLWDALLWFNLPFTFLKGMCSVAIAFLIYKHISPLLKGNGANR